MKTVLCIEDEQAFREDVAEYLQGCDYEVIEASSGIEGLKMIEQCQPDLVLCDINMPGMTGLELRQTLQRERPARTMPFVFLTAMADNDSQVKGKKLGCDDYLTKPVDFRVLTASIENALARAQQIREQTTQLRSDAHSMLQHQLAAPVHAITSYARLAEEDEARAPHYLREIRKLAQQQVWAIDKVLVSYRLELGRQELSLQPVLVDALLWEAQVMACSQTTTKQPEKAMIALDVEDDLPPLQADRDLLLQMLDALMRDALAEPGSASPAVSAARHDQGFRILIRGRGREDEAAQVQWLSPERDAEHPAMHHAMSFRGVNWQFASAVMKAHGGTLRLDLSFRDHPALALDFGVGGAG